ncbi:pirin family protein [Okeania hirsuta]|uniref:pirin family protein n=1 Tax=Okeania hirsuta TaxID=1458930 RepID=UPI0026782C8D
MDSPGCLVPLGKFEAGASDTYTINKAGNGVYAFVLEGDVSIEGQALNKRDGFGVWNTDKIVRKSEQ